LKPQRKTAIRRSSIELRSRYALHNIAAEHQPAASFGVYSEPLRFATQPEPSRSAASLLAADEALTATPILTPPELRIDPETYAQQVETIQAFLTAGDTYQVNFNHPRHAQLLASPLNLYDLLIEAQPSTSRDRHIDDRLTLSFSPELFFRIDGGTAHLDTPHEGHCRPRLTTLKDAEQRDWARQRRKEPCRNTS